MHSQTQMLHEINQEAFDKFEKAKDSAEKVEQIETDIDKYSYLVKRLFCVAAEQPKEVERLGIIGLDRLIYWESLNINLERVGDIQHEINLKLQDYNKEKMKCAELCTDTYGLQKIPHGCHENG